MYLDRFTVGIKRLERKYIPNLRTQNFYVIMRFILILPVVLLLKVVDKLFFKSTKIDYNKKNKLSNIIAGWTNLAFPSVEVEQLARKRAEVCASCPFSQYVGGIHTVVVDNKTQNIRGMKCLKCGCPLSAKVRSPHDSCPIGNW